MLYRNDFEEFLDEPVPYVPTPEELERLYGPIDRHSVHPDMLVRDKLSRVIPTWDLSEW